MAYKTTTRNSGEIVKKLLGSFYYPAYAFDYILSCILKRKKKVKTCTTLMVLTFARSKHPRNISLHNRGENNMKNTTKAACEDLIEAVLVTEIQNVKK